MAKANFEDNMENLEKIVTELEKGELNLDDSISKFEEGIKISKECNKILEEAEMLAKIQNEKIDISLPGSQLPLGTIHPLTMIREELEDLFIGMG